MARSGKVAKIGLVGTSCVGKSTSLEDIEVDLGRECEPVREAARTFFMYDYSPEMGGRYSLAVQQRIQGIAMRNERWAAVYAGRTCADIGRAAIVCDRTVFDAPVCVAAEGDEAGASLLMERAQDWVKAYPYDKIYLFDPADVPYTPDPIRTEPPETRDRFHHAYLTVFAEHGVPYELLGGTREQRLSIVRAAITEAYMI